MGLVIYVLFLAALVKTLVATGKPLLCTGIHALWIVAFGLIGGAPLPVLVLDLAVESVWAFAWFFALDYFGELTFWWLVTLVAGLALRFFLPLLF